MIQFNNKPPKKLVVKDLKNKPRISEEFEASALAKISTTIDSIFRNEPLLPYGHEEIYRCCETLCKFHLAGAVYKIIYEKCESAAISGSRMLIKECTELIDEVEYLKKVEEAWQTFQKHYNLLESLFLYLDKVYIPQQQKHHQLQQGQQQSQSQHQFINIKRFGLNFFRSFYLMNGENMGKEIIEKLMKLVETIRRDSISDTCSEMFQLAQVLICMIRELEEYSEGELEFENFFLQCTWKFYEQESQEEIIGDLSKYLKYAWSRMEYENEIICGLLSPITRDKLMRCVRERLISDRMGFLFPKPMGTSLRGLFQASDRESLKLLYEMINRVFAVEAMAYEWIAFIRLHGQELMSRGNDFRTIKGIAQFKEQVDSVILECFQSDPILQGTLKDAFETIMNGHGDRTAELLALYIHQKLKNPLLITGASSALEAFLSMALLLFRYLHRKEVFDSFYKRTLAQRLLFARNCNLALERQFINKLREDCGGGFVSRMESMLKDVEQSQELTKAFKETGAKLSKGISSVTSVTVISGLWPGESTNDASISNPNAHKPTNTLTLPSELNRLEESFSQFYTGQKKNCSLKWAEGMSSCVMRATFESGRYDLILTARQALLVLKFNSTPQISLERLSKEMKMDSASLKETLESLTSPLYPLLLKEAEHYRINESFKPSCKTVPLYALHSPFLPVEEEITEEDGGAVSSQSSPSLSISKLLVERGNGISERQYQVDSLLVRRMKMQTKSTRRDLINFVLSNLGNVKISSADLDVRIDGLIDKEFIKASSDGNSLTYLP